MAVDPLSHTLGRVEQALDTITKTLSEDRMAAAAFRTEIRREVSEVKDIVREMNGQVKSTVKEVAQIKPVVDDYRQRRDRGLGMADLTRTVWTVLIGVASLMVGVVLHAFWPNK